MFCFMAHEINFNLQSCEQTLAFYLSGRFLTLLGMTETLIVNELFALQSLFE
jgi:hypothetical protein